MISPDVGLIKGHPEHIIYELWECIWGSNPLGPTLWTNVWERLKGY